MAFNLSAESRELAEGVRAQAALPYGTTQGTNDFSKVGYGGPSPPAGKPHRYFFKFYALDQPLELRPGATKSQLLAAVKAHVLGEAQFRGTFSR